MRWQSKDAVVDVTRVRPAPPKNWKDTDAILAWLTAEREQERMWDMVRLLGRFETQTIEAIEQEALAMALQGDERLLLSMLAPLARHNEGNDAWRYLSPATRQYIFERLAGQRTATGRKKAPGGTKRGPTEGPRKKPAKTWLEHQYPLGVCECYDFVVKKLHDQYPSEKMKDIRRRAEELAGKIWGLKPSETFNRLKNRRKTSVLISRN